MYPGKTSPEHHVWSYLRMSTKSPLQDCKAQEDHEVSRIPQTYKARSSRISLSKAFFNVCLFSWGVYHIKLNNITYAMHIPSDCLLFNMHALHLVQIAYQLSNALDIKFLAKFLVPLTAVHIYVAPQITNPPRSFGTWQTDLLSSLILTKYVLTHLVFSPPLILAAPYV